MRIFTCSTGITVLNQMDNMRALYQLSLADFRERTRRYSFLVTMLGVLFFAYLVITGQYTIQFGEFRTLYSSAWAGNSMAVTSSIMLAIAGFYLVKGSIGRDRRTEIGQIIAATPVTSREYLISKFFSDVAVLWSMITVLAAVAFVTLLLRNETGTVNAWEFMSPFFIIALPASLFVAAVAVFFDTARWLRGSAGNIIYLFVAEFCIVLGMLRVPVLDLAGVSLFTNSVKAAAIAAYPGEKIGLLIGFVKFDKLMQVETFKTFPWNGIEWSAEAIALRLSWIAVAGIGLALALPFFDRFDPAKIERKIGRTKMKRRDAVSEAARPREHAGLGYHDLSSVRPAFRFVHLLAAELRVALKGYHWFWYAVALGLVTAQVAAPFEIARSYLAPLAMVWPLVIWSSMGTRETRYNTGPLLYSSPEPIARQLPVLWSAGIAVALAAVGAMVIRAGILGHWSYGGALVIAALFIPTAALALGILTGSRKLFEVVYLIVWYVGSIDKLAPLDLLGTTASSITAGKSAILLLLTAAFFICSFPARRMRLARSWS
jgi:hypothetical protein